MDITFLLRGIVLGFSIAAPVGPIGLLCIRRSIAEGRTTGFISGLGAATADALYGSIAAFGLSVLSGLLISHTFWLRLIGGVFLCYMGLVTFRAAPAAHVATAGGRTLLGAYVSTLLLTLTNPMTILSFAAILAGAGVGASGDAWSGAVLVLGVFAGSALWWLLLSSGASLLRGRLDLERLRWVNRVSGIVLSGFGVLVLISMSR